MTTDGGTRRTHTLPAAWYRDEAIYERERTQVFRRNWAPVGREQELDRPGAFLASEVAGWPVFVIRARDGSLRGFHNVCRHRAGPLVREATGHCNILRCHYHGWTYDLDGTLRKAPGFTDVAEEAFDPTEFGLFPVRVACWNGLVFACLDDDVADIETWLGEIPHYAAEFPTVAEMQYFDKVEMEVATNWKAHGDNAAEGYHLPFVHNDLDAASDEIDIVAYEDGRFVGFHVRYGGSGQRGSGKGFWVYKFPCMLFHFSKRGFNCERAVPLGAHRVRVTRWFWFVDLDPARNRAEVEDSATVMREDAGICEAVQRNLEAGLYEAGRLSASREPGPIFIQRLVREALGEAA